MFIGGVGLDSSPIFNRMVFLMKLIEVKKVEATLCGMYQIYINELYKDKSISMQDATDECEKWFELVGCTIYYISNDNDIVGFCIVGKLPQCNSKANWHIFEFYILPEYRRNHYGMFTMAELIHKYGQKVSLHILKSNIDGMLFWAKIAHTFNHHLVPVEPPELQIDDAIEYIID